MNRDHNDASIIKRLGGWTTIALLTLAIAMFAWSHIASALRPANLGNAGATISARSISAKSPQRKTVPIETLKVGDRVLAHNPEVSETERANWTEPNWNDWLQLSLIMPKADGSTLSIELLRPESWVREQMGLVVQGISDDRASVLPQPEPDPEASSLLMVESNDVLLPYSPMRPFFRDLAIAGVELEISGEELQAIFVEMDLPELAITGPAVVTEIQNAPLVKLGDGRVVTATFQHSSGDVIDLVVGDNIDSSQTTIGTTSNHPFWSEDRQEFIQAGQLAIGERLQTHSGDTKRVVSKLARPGPEPVYNLEVFAEHVYYVGQDGLLVHNSGPYAKITNGKPSRIFDNDVLVAASNSPKSSKGIVALRELAASNAFITPNQLREFTAFKGISASQLRARKAFLAQHNIQVLDGRTISSGTNFRSTFNVVAKVHGRGDAALLAFAKQTGMEAVTFEKRLSNFAIHTLRDPLISIRRLPQVP